jgi:DNA-binding MarR family transcriptional regulator
MAGGGQTSNPKDGAPDRVTDTTLRQFIGYHMKRAYHMIQIDLMDALKPFDLRLVTYSALVVIRDNPGLRQSQLADVLAIERPNLVVVVDELEQRDLIVRDRAPYDRRAYALRVTEAGETMAVAATKAVKDHESQLCSGMSPELHDAMLEALQSIWSMKHEGQS